MMCLMAGFFARCRLFWLKGSCATRAPFTGCDRDSTRWSRSFWPWLCWRWCVAVRWSRAVTCLPASGANYWAWIGYRRSKPCGEKSPTSAATTVRQPSGRAAWPGSGWPAPIARASGSSTPTATCASITVVSPICHAGTWPANGLCLRGTTDYWINGLGGAPFFGLTQPVNPGLIAVLRQSIVPRLVAEAPQPNPEALAADALLPRLTLIFDREGYSPDFFADLKAQRIAILTYHKFP